MECVGGRATRQYGTRHADPVNCTMLNRQSRVKWLVWAINALSPGLYTIIPPKKAHNSDLLPE